MDSNLFRVLSVLVCVGLAFPVDAKRRDNFAGPVSARVVEVIDGDTFLADAEIWPGQTLRVNIRIRGIDAPEMKCRCRGERDAALAARAALGRLIAGGPVSLSNIGGAKFYGRVLADVITGNGEAVARRMLQNGLVRAYGGGKRDSWCG